MRGGGWSEIMVQFGHQQLALTVYLAEDDCGKHKPYDVTGSNFQRLTRQARIEMHMAAVHNNKSSGRINVSNYKPIVDIIHVKGDHAK